MMKRWVEVDGVLTARWCAWRAASCAACTSAWCCAMRPSTARAWSSYPRDICRRCSTLSWISPTAAA